MQDKSCDLSRCFLCRHTSPELKDLIALKKNTSFFKKGRTIIEEGEPVKGMFFINEGAVKVHRTQIGSYWIERTILAKIVRR